MDTSQVPKFRPVEPNPVRTPQERMKSLFDKSKIDVDPAIPLKLYYNSSRQMLRMAGILHDEKSYEKSFVLYSKYLTLFVEKLPNHPGYKELIEQDLSLNQKKSANVTAELRDVFSNKKKIHNIFDIVELIKKKNLLPTYEKEYNEYLKAKQKYEVDLKLYNEAQKTLNQKRLEEQSENRLKKLQNEFDRKKEQILFPISDTSNANTVPNEIDIDALPDLTLEDLNLESSSGEDGDSENDDNSSNLVRPSAPSLPIVPDRSSKPKNLLSNFSEEDELTKMIVPFRAVTEKFMNLARANTLRNIETCAILAGKLSQNCFTITHLLVPKQNGTSDTCSATNEEELFMEQEKQDLLTVGWIHTHPTQKAFLSSVDLHTHAPYQKMLPEAIAIVVAPKFHEIGLYSLSDYGLEFILRCYQTGFHPHPNESQIYGRAGHVIIDNTLDVNIVDFR